MHRLISTVLAAGVVLAPVAAYADEPPSEDGNGKLTVYQLDRDGRILTQSAIAAQGGHGCVRIPMVANSVREVFDNDSGSTVDIYFNGACSGIPIVRAPYGSRASIGTGHLDAMGVVFR
ncbi:hypothetical protein [Actinomadura rupiterrae]|uniref:hypothetical protein n=1 Tax=Actinomadura rupiterrae TaxID=559627 RepID=UPI0020A33981|nr:hypothetical protein [Actinomadura rupiterrae]MCP2338720.1 hypothetical protein [Actinomadura rupiterrae]